MSLAADIATYDAGHHPDRRHFGRQRLVPGMVTRATRQTALRLFASPLYRYTLLGRTPADLRILPADPWPGDGLRGREVIDGTFTIAGQALRRGHPVWWPRGASEDFLAGMHGFAWLRDLRAAGGGAARQRARDLITDWIERHPGWTDLAWRPDVLSTRVINWLVGVDFFGQDADAGFRRALLDSLARQARHLSRTVPGDLAGSDLILAIKGLIYLGLCLPGGDARLRRGVRLLDRELARQVLADGGHVERSPSTHLTVLRHLVEIRGLLRDAGHDMPTGLQGAIDRMAPVLRLYRHGDGKLALFNDSHEDEGWRIDLVLRQADSKGRPPPQAPHTGFQRLQAGRTLLLVDAGAPSPAGLDRHAHAGLLSVELSVGKERMIVNCGAHPGSHPTWTEALRATAAHSTVTIDDTNAAEVLPDGGIGRRPRRVACRRETADGNIWLEAQHDGYRQSFGLVHQRRLFLAAGGDDLRGEDSLRPATQGLAGRTGGRHVAIRFHLHPTVQATRLQEPAAARIQLPSGLGWRLRANAGTLDLVESVYMGQDGLLQRSRQIVITTPVLADGVVVKWSLRREARA